MKERPIPMSAPNIVPILESRKTQTRRVIGPQPHASAGLVFVLPRPNAKGTCAQFGNIDDGGIHSHESTVHCPYGRPGEKLWVREAWRTDLSLDPLNGKEIGEAAIRAGYPTGWAPIQYEADGARRDWVDHFNGSEPNRPGRYRHARFMPRWASRILLEITDIRVERLQEISEADAVAEGIKRSHHGNRDQWIDYPEGSSAAGWTSPRDSYRSLWNSINGQGSWNVNPWVWVIAFRRLSHD